MYKVKTLVKKAMGLVLATLVAFGVMAGTTQAFAGSSAKTVKQGALEKNNKPAEPATQPSNPSDKYTEVDMQEPIILDAELHVYSVKDGDKGSPAAKIILTHKNLGKFDPQLTGVREYTATAEKGWVFKKWTYEQFLNGNDRGNYHALFYSFSESHDKKNTPYTSGNVISVNRTGAIGESALIKRIYKVYANLNPTITATAGEGGSIIPADAGVSIAPDGTTEVPYGGNQEYKFTANEGYVIASLKIDGEEHNVEHTASGSYEFKAVKSPHTIEVSFAKAYTITYTDGVDGEKIFADQVHKNLLVNTLTPAFEGTGPNRKDYDFAGWNPTVAEKVTDNATYVAQWKRIQRTVTFKDGDKTHATVKVETGKAIDTDDLKDQSMPASPTKDGYTFKEWNTQKDGQGTAFTVTTTVNKDLTVYAIYTKNPVTPPAPEPKSKTPAPAPASKPQSKTQDPKTQDPKSPASKPKSPKPAPKLEPKPVTKPKSTPKTPAPKPEPKPAPKSQPETPYSETSDPEQQPDTPATSPTPTSAPDPQASKLQSETQASESHLEMPASKLQSEIPDSKQQHKTAAPKLQPEKRAGVIPKTGESASFAGLLAAFGFSIAGLAILRKKKMMEENIK